MERPPMNWLLDNPISEMPGPLFLALYAGVIGLLMVEAYLRNHRSDRSMPLGPAPIPTKPDPVEIAYLRGAENEVTRLLVFDPIRRGDLRVVEKKWWLTKATDSKIEHAADRPDVTRLSPIEADAFG